MIGEPVLSRTQYRACVAGVMLMFASNLQSQVALGQAREALVAEGVVVDFDNDVRALDFHVQTSFLIVELTAVWSGSGRRGEQLLLGVEVNTPGMLRNGQLDPDVWAARQRVVFTAIPFDPSGSSGRWCYPVLARRPPEEAMADPNWLQNERWASSRLERLRPIRLLCAEHVRMVCE